MAYLCKQYHVPMNVMQHLNGLCIANVIHMNRIYTHMFHITIESPF